MHYVPVKYKFGNSSPDVLVSVKCPRVYRTFGILSTIIVTLFIIYWYYEACFGQTTLFEKLFLIGVNCIFNIMHASQWHILLSDRRLCGLNVTNAALETAYQISKSFPLSFEMLCFLLCSSSFIYPIIYFPCIVLVTLYLPGAFLHLHKAIDFLVMGIISNAELVPFYGMVTRCVMYAMISAALGHAVVNCMVFLHWLFTYLFATTARVDDMLRQKR